MVRLRRSGPQGPGRTPTCSRRLSRRPWARRRAPCSRTSTRQLPPTTTTTRCRADGARAPLRSRYNGIDSSGSQLIALHRNEAQAEFRVISVRESEVLMICDTRDLILVKSRLSQTALVFFKPFFSLSRERRPCSKRRSPELLSLRSAQNSQLLPSPHL